MLPAASIARTLKSYVPSGLALRSNEVALVHGAQAKTTVAPRSTRHSNVAPASPVNDHAGAVALPGDDGEEVIDGAAGGVRSRTYELVAAAPVLAAASVARTRKS